jgi:hypothetical protein
LRQCVDRSVGSYSPSLGTSVAALLGRFTRK